MNEDLLNVNMLRKFEQALKERRARHGFALSRELVSQLSGCARDLALWIF